MPVLCLADGLPVIARCARAWHGNAREALHGRLCPAGRRRDRLECHRQPRAQLVLSGKVVVQRRARWPRPAVVLDIYVFLSERGSGALQGMGRRVLPAGKNGVAGA